MKEELNGTTLTPYSCKDFDKKEVSNAYIIIEEIKTSGIDRGTKAFRNYLYSRLDFYKVSVTCLMTTQNHIDKINNKQ